jgi:hypothetical protein
MRYARFILTFVFLIREEGYVILRHDAVNSGTNLRTFRRIVMLQVRRNLYYSVPNIKE